MLLESYRLEIFNSKCNPAAMSVHCMAHLDQDVGRAIPLLNSYLGGFTVTREPPSVTFKTQGKLITVHGDRIAINAIKDEAEADKIVQWLKQEINYVWANKDTITPSFEPMPRPQVIEILKRLPMTNCRKCGAPTCMVFAAYVAEGGKNPDDCPELSEAKNKELADYLHPFHLDI